MMQSKIRTALGLLGLLFSFQNASAATLVDTIGSDTFCAASCGSLAFAYDVSIYSAPPQGQSLAFQFTTATAATITSVKAFIASNNPGNAAGSVDLGIMADSASLPSGSFLFDSDASTGYVSPVTLSSLNWSIAAGTYWLVAMPVGPNANFNYWQGSDSLTGTLARTYPDYNSAWEHTSSDHLPEALITADVASTPLPAALPLFASGLGALGLLGWRRKRKAQATA